MFFAVDNTDLKKANTTLLEAFTTADVVTVSKNGRNRDLRMQCSRQ